MRSDRVVREGDPGGVDRCRSLWKTPGVAAATGARGCVWPGEEGDLSLLLAVGGPLGGAPCPGRAGAPSQFVSGGGGGGGAQRVQQSSSKARIARRCSPPPRCAARCYPAAGAPAAAASSAEAAAPPPRRLHAQSPPAVTASPAPGSRLGSFLSLLVFAPSHRRLLASTPCLLFAKFPCPSRSKVPGREQEWETDSFVIKVSCKTPCWGGGSAVFHAFAVF
ncbi:uncharacterized protein isoform X2 [Castor canadensis]|uniref:Uncharacterized protein isoform X2 n=1 Tax=Castor canadensis TaxID=51338 RepID=A0AC58N909_CASCN